MKLDPTRAGQDRQKLADALHELRKASGLSGDRLARRCGMSQSKVSRIETVHVLPSVVDVEQILTALGIDAAVRNELLALARVANTEYQDVRASVRRGLHYRQRELAALESSATQMLHFLQTLITGYSKRPSTCVPLRAPPIAPVTGDISKATTLKLQRQAVLQDETTHFEFLRTESAPPDADGLVQQ